MTDISATGPKELNIVDERRHNSMKKLQEKDKEKHNRCHSYRYGSTSKNTLVAFNMDRYACIEVDENQQPLRQ